MAIASSMTGSPPVNSSFDSIDAALAELNDHKVGWAEMDTRERLGYLISLRRGLLSVADDWVAASCQHKGIQAGPGRGEEWLAGPYSMMRQVRLLTKSLAHLVANDRPLMPGPVRPSPTGGTAVQVFPTGYYDRLFFMGTKAEVWLTKKVDPAELGTSMASAYRGEPSAGSLCLVLGGGNVSSIGPMDVIHKLFVEKAVVLLKMHPVNAYLGPMVEKAFVALIRDGFVKVVYGDVKEGSYLCNHDSVDEIHITGSDKTHDVIVFGPQPTEAKQNRQPLLTKPISSELGNVSPVIIIPGSWTDGDIEFQAENIASSLVNNAGFNCNASRVLITHKSWPFRRKLLDAVSRKLALVPRRIAYYPGAEQRYAAFMEAHPTAKKLGSAPDGALPWTFIENVDSNDADNICFQTEAFCGVFCETNLEAESTEAFLEKAVDFANNVLWGTLNATLLVKNAELEKAGKGSALTEAVAKLRYGTVSINHWAAIGYAMCSTTWGAYPGHDIYDIRSGKGVVHNTYLLDEVEKSVVYGPFRPMPKPAWFAGHSRGASLGKRLTHFEAKPGLLKLPGIFWNALLG